jgi:hypothetical protein
MELPAELIIWWAFRGCFWSLFFSSISRYFFKSLLTARKVIDMYDPPCPLYPSMMNRHWALNIYEQTSLFAAGLENLAHWAQFWLRSSIKVSYSCWLETVLDRFDIHVSHGTYSHFTLLSTWWHRWRVRFDNVDAEKHFIPFMHIW